MTILIIEDEPLVAKNLQRLVKDLRPKATLIGPIESVAQALQWFQEQPMPSLILADIQLADGVSFDIFKQISVGCPIIFTTAYDEYALRAFKLNSIDYLLKPIDKIELQRAFEKFDRWQSLLHPTDLTSQISHLLQDLENRTAKKYKQRFTAHYQRSVVAVPDVRVAYFVRDEIIWLVSTDQQRLITDFDSLDALEELLNPSDFFRVNRQYIVRRAAIESYRSHHTGRIELKLTVPTKDEVSISKDRAAQFRVWFED
ncbi:MAG: LytR/AlgR family response regulator transcription factor [Runella sp.]